MEVIYPAFFIFPLIGILIYDCVKKNNQNTHYSILLLSLILPILVLISFSNYYFVAFFQEDFIGEWATAFFFIAAGVTFGKLAWRAIGGRRTTRILDAFVLFSWSAVSFFIAGEETSWGQRLLGYKPANFFLENNYQQEFNIHNIFMYSNFSGITISVGTMTLILTVFVMLVYPFFVYVLKDKKIFQGLDIYQIPIVVIPWYFFVYAVEKVYPWRYAGEFAEYVLGVTFFIIATVYYARFNKIKSFNVFRQIGKPVTIIVLLSVLTPFTVNFLFGLTADSKIVIINEELNNLKKHITSKNFNIDSLLDKSRVHKRVYTAIKEKYIQPKPTLAISPDEYFTDPWGNAYWVHYKRSINLLTIYSFGANRRRDSHKRDEGIFEADDIYVSFNPEKEEE